MKFTRRQLFGVGAGAAVAAVGSMIGWPASGEDVKTAAAKKPFAVTHTDAEWRKMLTSEQYEILRQEGTERPFSSPLNDEHRAGIFACVGCSQHLYSSKTKFDSGTGWPSFWKPLDHAVRENTDRSFGMSRTEVQCDNCGGHLGHVFDDGPKPTGLRYCMDGVAMKFIPEAA